MNKEAIRIRVRHYSYDHKARATQPGDSGTRTATASCTSSPEEAALRAVEKLIPKKAKRESLQEVPYETTAKSKHVIRVSLYLYWP